MRKVSDYPPDYIFDRLSSCCGAEEHSHFWECCGVCNEHAFFVLYDYDNNEVEDDSSTQK